MHFIQTDYFLFHPSVPFEGIVTDIPYKGCISDVFYEKRFNFHTFLQKADHDTLPNSFLITFCNLLCLHDLLNACVDTSWHYHCYAIWNKEPLRTWISWSLPLRSCEFILFLKKGNFQYCFKNGQIHLPYKRSSFGGELKDSTPNTNEIAEGCYSEIFTFKSPRNKIHPTQKPAEFSKVFSRITHNPTFILDPFCGSGSLLSAFPDATGIDIEKYVN